MKIALIRANQNKTTSGPYRHIMSNMNKVDIVASFQTGYYVSGVAPVGDNLVVLAYIPGEEDREKEFSNSVPLRQVFIFLSGFNLNGNKFFFQYYTKVAHCNAREPDCVAIFS